MSAPPVGVLLMAHGTPRAPDEVEAFYTRIRRGRAPSVEQLAELAQRYALIGGTSPLAARTQAQVAGVRAQLELAEPGRYVVAFGAKHTDPTIEDAARALVAAGADPVVGLVLTPHASSMGSGEYLDRAAEALGATVRGQRSPAFVPVRHWYDAPGFADLLAERVLAALATLPAGSAEETAVLFTAHSLPERVLQAGDPYRDQVVDSAARVAGAAGVSNWRVAWQSAGRTPEPWIGPDVREVLSGLPALGVTGAVVCPVGFVADHLEVLYDIDIEARRVAAAAGLAFARTESLDDDPAFLHILAGVLRRAVAPTTPLGERD